MVTSCETAEQYHRQDTDSDTIRVLLRFPILLVLISVCEHAHIFSFIPFQYMHRFLYPLAQSQYTTAPCLPEALLLPFYNHALLLPAQPLHSYLLATTNLVSISIILLFQNCYVNEIIESVSFISWPFYPAAFP